MIVEIEFTTSYVPTMPAYISSSAYRIRGVAALEAGGLGADGPSFMWNGDCY